MGDHTCFIKMILKSSSICCYLKPEANKTHDDFSTDLKPLICSHQTLKLFSQGHLLQTEDIQYIIMLLLLCAMLQFYYNTDIHVGMYFCTDLKWSICSNLSAEICSVFL